MKKTINHPLLAGMSVELDTNPWGFQVKNSILVSGQKANELEKNVFSLQNTSGETVKIEVKKGKIFKPLPDLSINGDQVTMSRPLQWYEHIFVFFPLVLLLGGAIGGALGALSAYMNYFNFQKESLSTASRLLIAFGTNTAAFIVYTIAATVLAILLH